MLHSIRFFLGIFLWIPSIIISKDIILLDQAGENYYLAIDPNDKFGDVIEDLTVYAQSSNLSTLPVTLNLLVTEKQVLVKSFVKKRDYHAPLTKHEKQDLDFLVTKMAWEKNPKRLWDLKSEMDKAGDRINHIHPFKFLEGICTDEKLCVGLKAIRKRTILVWPHFVKGNVNSLKEEHQENNVLPYVEEFAKTIGVDANLLMPLAKAQKWEEFVKTVADKVERPTISNRYNM